MIRGAAAAVAFVVSVCALVPLVGSPEARSARPVVAGRVHRSHHPTEGKVFVLVIGNDARAGNPDRSRADAIHIVGLDTKTLRGGILNFPRDSWVTIPGHGSGRINEALYLGGPRLLAQTLESVTGIRLDYWVMTGFEGFRGLVRGIRGVRLTLGSAIYDPTGSGANLRAGRQVLGAGDALAFVRTRKVLSGGDVARTTNQARFLLAMLRELRRDVRGRPASVFKWIALGRRHTRFDMSPEETFRLAIIATQVRADRVRSVTVPVTIGSVGAASVVFISPSAQGIFTRFRGSARL